jgi:hypothetical protein
LAAALRRLSLESVIHCTIAATIVAVAGSASWSADLRSIAAPVRAAGIAGLFVLGLGYALKRRTSSMHTRAAFVAAGCFLALAAASATWSVDPTETMLRGGAFGLLIAAAAALGAGVAGQARAARRLLYALLAGSALVALIGLAIYVVSPDDALQPATGDSGARFRGLGQNPNTVAMLFAATLPLAALLLVDARSARGRVLAGVTFLLLAGSIAASGSRGAIAAACAGLLLFGLFAVGRAISRVAVIVGVVVLGVVLAAIASFPEPLSRAEAAKVKSPAGNTERYTPNDAQYVVRLEDEIGYSGGSHGRSTDDLWSGSGRLDAWRGALAQGDERRLLGYGFGTESAVFVDRFQDFQGGVPENSFIGLFLQLGIVGVGLFAVLGAALAVAAVRSLKRDRALAATCIGVIGAGIVLSMVQSFFYAVGNVATLTLWVSAFLPAARASE